MSAPPLKTKVRNCQRKRRYNDEIGARAAALYQAETWAEGVMYVYRCPECSGWHLTHKNGGKSGRVEAGKPYATQLHVTTE